MQDCKIADVDEVAGKTKNEHEAYGYSKKEFVSDEAKQCRVAVYEIEPGKSAYPYHYHVKNEEVFYIISGTGLLRTPVGEREVRKGELIFFPANEKGAHKLTNHSLTEKLVYIDFDTYNDLDVAFYPDSGKVGIWGRDISQVHKTDNAVPYYEGE